MNKKLFLAALLLISSTAFAQNTSVSQIEKRNTVSSEGFRVSLLRSNLSYKYKGNFFGVDFNETFKVDRTVGLSLGYVSFPVQQIGWSTNAAIMELKNESTVKVWRADGNLGYAFNPNVLVKAGLNLSNMRNKEADATYKPNIGAQAGFGFQFNKNLGLDLSYVIMRQTIVGDITTNGVKTGELEIDGTLSGTELALTGTF